MRSNISSKLIFASCVWYSDRAHYELCVLIKDIGRRLPLQLQCSYQGQQDDFCQSVRENYKTRFWGGQNLYIYIPACLYHDDCWQCRGVFILWDKYYLPVVVFFFGLAHSGRSMFYVFFFFRTENPTSEKNRRRHSSISFQDVLLHQK